MPTGASTEASNRSWIEDLEYPGSLTAAAAGVTALTCSVVAYLALKYLEPTSPAAANTLYKLKLYRKYFSYFIFSKDKSYDATPPVELGREKIRKKIVFCRHGESEWNLVFNKGFGPSFLVRLSNALIREIMLIPTRDSIFIDSSLSDEGLAQVAELRKFVSSPNAPVFLREPNSSTLVTSNLRRAIETGSIAFQNRIAKSSEQMRLLSSLQEMSRNVDASALAEAGKIPDLTVVLANIDSKAFDPVKVYDATGNNGNKPLKSNGLIRMKEFCDWSLHKQADNVIVVAGGHSLWFRNFFRAYLPERTDYIGKNKKIVNCGVVSFDLVEDESGCVMIDPNSLNELYGGYSGVQAKKGA
eukprot:CAMPEP_0184746602 /NCGR_PEP_ID=MMETSP0315-20130426/9132_1 /TAXON_ID=101924 /ORGANISM="Rhodosorus marinus, Strain UTEX LB 2760" /LENGTH=356 /DNA_ID=CAMNT_0027219257 /DNA_START=91 /DNA_END=1161 /DNA_ORIENTATION=-